MFNRFRRIPPSSATTAGKGRFFEHAALTWLQKHGLKAVTRNFHSRFGEIDLILRDGDVLVFVEVRYRKKQSHGSPLETVHYHKRRKIIKTAQYYLQKNGLTGKVPCRFDVIGITGTGESLHYRWIRNAFQY